MDIKELKFQVWRLSEMEKKYQIEIQQFKDKLHRRNMQIKDLKDKFKHLGEVRKIQVADPKSKTDAYMRGLANGLILAEACITEEEVNYIKR